MPVLTEDTNKYPFFDKSISSSKDNILIEELNKIAILLNNNKLVEQLNPEELKECEKKINDLTNILSKKLVKESESTNITQTQKNLLELRDIIRPYMVSRFVLYTAEELTIAAARVPLLVTKSVCCDILLPSLKTVIYEAAMVFGLEEKIDKEKWNIRAGQRYSFGARIGMATGSMIGSTLGVTLGTLMGGTPVTMAAGTILGTASGGSVGVFLGSALGALITNTIIAIVETPESIYKDIEKRVETIYQKTNKAKENLLKKIEPKSSSFIERTQQQVKGKTKTSQNISK